MLNPVLLLKLMNPIARIVIFVWLSSLFLLLPLPILRGREMKLLDVEAIAQDRSISDNSVSLTDFDRELLEKAIENFFGGYRYETQLQIRVDGEGQFDGLSEAFSLTIHSHSKIVIDTVPKFHVQVTLKNDLGEIEGEYEFISNGERVWVHDPKTFRYAILTPEEFLDSESYLTLGMSSFLFIKFAEMINIVLLSKYLPEDIGYPFSIDQMLQIAIADGDFPLTRTILQESDREYYIYELDDPNMVSKTNFWIDPETEHLHKLVIAGEEENKGEFILRENIIQRQEIPDSENIDFQFIPSARAEQVETINIFDF